jgi:hypothetical protein
MKKFSIALAFVAASALAVTSAQANTATGSTYGEVGYGTYTEKAPGWTASQNMVRGIVGYQVTPVISVEGHAATGVGDMRAKMFNRPIPTYGANIDHSFGAFVKATLPVSQNLSVFGRAGMTRTTVSVGRVSDSSSNAAFGAGASYLVNKNSALTLDYTSYDTKAGSANTVFAGYNFKF